jgi:hypothetical protein
MFINKSDNFEYFGFKKILSEQDKLRIFDSNIDKSKLSIDNLLKIKKDLFS